MQPNHRQVSGVLTAEIGAGLPTPKSIADKMAFHTERLHGSAMHSQTGSTVIQTY
jgi:hypothetical protein